MFANFYLNGFDHFLKHDLGIPFYGRYVDDFVIVHEDRAYLRSLIETAAEFLQALKLTVHPKKIYLQHYANGVKFLGVFLKPHRLYMTRRNKGNFYAAIARKNEIIRCRKPTAKERMAFLSSLNSYLGLMAQYNTYRLREKMLKQLACPWWNFAHVSGNLEKLVLKSA